MRLHWLSWIALGLAAGCGDGLTEGVERGVYAIDISDVVNPGNVLTGEVRLELHYTDGVLRLGSRERAGASRNGRALAALELARDHLFAEVTYQNTRGDGLRFNYRAGKRVDAKTLSGTSDYCVTPVSTGVEACRRRLFTATRIERIAGEGETQGLALVGAVALPAEGKAVNVRVANGVAYVADYEGGFVTVDVHDPARPRVLGQLPTGGDGEIWNDVKIAPDPRYVLVASSEYGMLTVDVRDPANPASVARFPGGNGANVHTIFVEGNLAYAADITANGVRVADVSDAAQPREVGRHAVGSKSLFVHDLFVRDGLAYLNAWGIGFRVVDFTKVNAPVTLGRYEYARMTSHSSWVSKIGDRLIALHGDEDFTGHLRVLDVTSPGTMRLLGEWQLRPEVSIHNVMLLGTRAYIAHYQDGVRVLDLSRPEAPRQEAYFNTWGFDSHPGTSFYEGVVGLDVDQANHLIYAADSARGLLILREL